MIVFYEETSSHLKPVERNQAMLSNSPRSWGLRVCQIVLGVALCLSWSVLAGCGGAKRVAPQEEATRDKEVGPEERKAEEDKDRSAHLAQAEQLERLKEMVAKQERVRALTEKGALAKDQQPVEFPSPARGGTPDGAPSGNQPSGPAADSAIPSAPPGRGIADPTRQRELVDTRGKTSPSEKKPGQSPQVWRSDRARPTVARVYVGDGNTLELVSLHVSVTVNGPRARTVVDHVFRNPHDRQLEGTFEYPLPTGASPSYFAMFLGSTREDLPQRFARRDNAPLPENALAALGPTQLVTHVDHKDWGRLQEARVVSKPKALETYEEIVRGRIDPALLEYAGGNTFQGRVFPIAARGYNRVILAYEELLPVSGERMLYRFPLPGRALSEMGFALQTAAAEGRAHRFLPEGGKKEEEDGRLIFKRSWTGEKPDGELLFSCVPADPTVQFLAGRQGESGPCSVYARLRPELPAVEKPVPFASQAVFLLDTSLSEQPDRFGVSMALLKRILESDPAIKQFNILTFNVGAAWVSPSGFLPNTAEGRKQALDRLDGLLLEGATDFSCALEKLVRPGFELAAGTPLNCFLLSDGQITWGADDVATLTARFEKRCPFSTRFHCYRTGLGAENLELFEALTRQGGGIFNCFGEADLATAAAAHRHHCLKVERVRFKDGPGASDVLVAGRRAAVYPGGELIVAARLAGTGKTRIVVEGKFQGKPLVQEFAIEVGGRGSGAQQEMAGRAWAEVAVSSLLALNDARYDTLVTAYCQQYGIGSRVASFLVLENEADYKRLNLEEERGKTLTGDLGLFLSNAWSNLAREMTARQAFERFVQQVNPRVKLLEGEQGEHVRKLLTLLSDKDFELTGNELTGALLRQSDVPASYLAERKMDQRSPAPYLGEARRRTEKGDVAGAVRVLSSVVEEHPGRADALRLVGYRLLDLKQAEQAARLFQQVQRQRPFEPHSYRDLARSLEEMSRYGLAAVQYEIVLAGAWHNRFGAALKQVVQEEYARMMQQAIREGKLDRKLADHFGARLERLSRANPAADLRVTITWNTDATDVDLWVIEPDGAKCFYQDTQTRNGGKLSQDQTQGYGPERYEISKAPAGEFKVIVHYFAPNRNLLGGETHVQVVVTQHAGTPQESVVRHTVILKKHNEEVEVCKIKF